MTSMTYDVNDSNDLMNQCRNALKREAPHIARGPLLLVMSETSLLKTDPAIQLISKTIFHDTSATPTPYHQPTTPAYQHDNGSRQNKLP